MPILTKPAFFNNEFVCPTCKTTVCLDMDFKLTENAELDSCLATVVCLTCGRHLYITLSMETECATK